MKIRKSLFVAFTIFLGMVFSSGTFAQNWGICEPCAANVDLNCGVGGRNSPCGTDPNPPSIPLCVQCWNDQCTLLNQNQGQNSPCMYESEGKWYSCCPIASSHSKGKKASPSM